jgi:hypothetical protein
VDSRAYSSTISQVRADLEAATVTLDDGSVHTFWPEWLWTAVTAVFDIAEASNALRGGPGVEFRGFLEQINDGFDRLDRVIGRANPQEFRNG